VKKLLEIFIFVVALAAAGLVYYFWPTGEALTYSNDFKSAAYQVDGITTFINQSSVAGIETKYFGNEARGDINGDGFQDVAFLFTQDGGGSGTFYYLAVALNSAKGYQGTNAVFLGDRIAPQSTEYRDGKIIVNYVVRRPDEPMAAQPSVGVSKYFQVKNGLVVEVTSQ
jgi:hypothetical protein